VRLFMRTSYAPCGTAAFWGNSPNRRSHRASIRQRRSGGAKGDQIGVPAKVFGANVATRSVGAEGLAIEWRG
jgi:hypothetical protein